MSARLRSDKFAGKEVRQVLKPRVDAVDVTLSTGKKGRFFKWRTEMYRARNALLCSPVVKK